MNENSRLELEKLHTGFTFVEGPVWHKGLQCLFFTDIPENTIYRYDDVNGVRIYRKPSGGANGLAIDLQGRLLACQHNTRQVTAMLDGEQARPIATHYRGKRLNSPNDVIVRSDGLIFFTDPPYGLNNPQEQELPFQGVYCLDPRNGELTLLVADFERPNGLAFSPDEQVLYIDDSAKQHVRAFDVTPEGRLRNGRLFAELDPAIGAGVPDGLKVDAEGNLYVTGPGGIWMIAPSGESLGVLRVPEIAANVAWGGEDGRQLFITATTSLYRVRFL